MIMGDTFYTNIVDMAETNGEEPSVVFSAWLLAI